VNTTDSPTFRLRAQQLATWERDGLKAALAGARLPVDDIAEPDRLFWRFETLNDVPVGFGGLEVHGKHALVRSVVTLPPLRKRGIGRAIIAALETEAQLRGCEEVFVLTTGSTELFSRFGYTPCDCAQMPDEICRTQEFAALMAAAASPMVKRL
jgi:N-acetylglutamate synthase-like GNAT family acetyltransferase